MHLQFSHSPTVEIFSGPAASRWVICNLEETNCQMPFKCPGRGWGWGRVDLKSWNWQSWAERSIQRWSQLRRALILQSSLAVNNLEKPQRMAEKKTLFSKVIYRRLHLLGYRFLFLCTEQIWLFVRSTKRAKFHKLYEGLFASSKGPDLT